MKASEHFDLPLEADQEHVYQSDGTDEWVAEFNTPEQAQIAAKCINHADKLAEALAVMIQSIYSEPSFRPHAEEFAEKALAAYRGAK